MRRGGRLIAATALLAVGEIALAARPRPAKGRSATPPPAAVLRRVDVAPGGARGTIALVLDKPTQAEAFTLDGPRLVIDLAGASTGLAGQTIEVNDAFVQRIRIGRHDAPERKVRVVLDLAQPTEFELRPDGTTIVVALAAAAMPTAPGAKPGEEVAAPRLPEAVPSALPSAATMETSPVPAAPQTSPPSATAQTTPPPTATPPRTATPTATPSPTSPPPSTATPTAAATSSAPRPTPRAAATEPRGTATPAHPARGTAGPSPAAESPAAESAAPPAERAPQEAEAEGAVPSHGPRISIEFHDADVTTVIDLIASTAGYQVLFAPGVHGRITVKIVDRPWEEALDLVLRERRLTQTRVEDVILVSPIGARHRAPRP